MFYQSTGSSSCAICAMGNLLALYGFERNRGQIIDLFENPANRRLPHVNHPRLLAVAAQCFPRTHLQWRRFASFSMKRLAPVLTSEIGCGRPLLMTFHIRHVKKEWAGIHCVLVVGVDQAGIHVIDSLGRWGKAGANSTILPHET